MYYAEKNGIKCRIPDRLVESYQLIGYKCTEIKPIAKEKLERKPKTPKSEIISE